MTGARAVFVDKDGTLVENLPYNVDPARVVFSAGAPQGAALLTRNGWRLVVVSNQSGVARGYFEESALEGTRSHLDRLLEASGAHLDGFYCCPHHPDGSVEEYAVACACRKPAPGLLVRAARELGLDLASSWMVGDILDDIEAGHAAGVRAILVDCGNETEWRRGPLREPDAIVGNFSEAARYIVREAARGEQERR